MNRFLLMLALGLLAASAAAAARARFDPTGRLPGRVWRVREVVEGEDGPQVREGVWQLQKDGRTFKVLWKNEGLGELQGTLKIEAIEP